MTKRQLATLIMVIFCITFASAIDVFSKTEGPRYGGTLVVTNYEDPKTLQPHFQYDSALSWAAGCIYNTLIGTNAEWNVIVPDLAKSWEVSKNGLIYTFQLSKGVTWHDGHKFTSADVKWTIDSILNKKGISYNNIKIIKEVEIPDDYTVVIKLNEFDAAFLNRFAYSLIYILPKHLYEGTDWTKNPYNIAPVGTGPFKFLKWIKGGHWSAVANEKYFKGRPYLDKIVWKTFPSPVVAMEALLAGDIGYNMVPPSFKDIAMLRDRREAQVVLWRQSRTTQLSINIGGPYLEKKKVREAIRYAINRTELIEKAYHNLFEEGQGIFGAHSKVFNPDTKTPKYSPAMAEKLLDEAGYPRGADGMRFKIEIKAIPGYGDEEACEVIKQNLAKVGIDLKINILGWASLYEKCFKPPYDYDLAISWGPFEYDPDAYYDAFHSTSFENIGGYSNSEVDMLLAQTRKILDKEKRKKLFYRIQKIIYDDVVIFSLNEYGGFYPFGLQFHDFFFQPHLVKKMLVHDFSSVWWEGGKLEP